MMTTALRTGDVGTDVDELSSPIGATADSATVAVWTAVSRLTGVARVIAIGAVLGPTFLGNTFQFTNTLPNLIYYGFLAGSLFSSLLVPALVGHLDRGDAEAGARVAGGFLGLSLIGLAVLAPLAVVIAPSLLRASGSGGDAAAQEHVARWLLVMFVPQILCYAVIGTSTAVMNAHRRFALAAAAPAVENVGMIAVLLLIAAVWGTEVKLADVSTGELLVLGLGATAAVMLHALLQWYGARRSGVRVWPRRGWQQPEVREVVRRAGPALVQATLYALQILVLLVLANRVAGGVVVFQIALNFFAVPIALGATPVALSLLPRLSRLRGAHDRAAFRDTWLRGLSLALFITVPIAVLLAAVAAPLAHAIALGRLSSADSVSMLATVTALLAPAVVAQTAFLVATYTSYSIGDTRRPLRAMALQSLTCGAVACVSLLFDGPAALELLALAFGVGVSVSSIQLNWSLHRRYRDGREAIAPALGRAALAAALMAGPAWACASVGYHVAAGKAAAFAGAVLGGASGLGVFVGVQWLLRAPELSWIGGLLGPKRRQAAL